MLRIKKLDIFVLKSFCTMFAGTFLICLFIFMMQFLWKYVDIMVGKGLEMAVLGKFFFYSALTLIPISLPLAVLLASLITFGNFGERFELLAMKAAGISLIKIMRPLIVFVCFVSAMSFYFQNVVGPIAQKKLWTLVISMKQKSPEIDIPEGVFYDEINGYNLYVKHRNRDTGMLYDILIYNFEKGFNNAEIIKADSGRMEMTPDKKHLYLHLFSGEQFGNLKQNRYRHETNYSYARQKFTTKSALIDFNSDFKMIDEGFMSSQSNSKDIWQLQHDMDSIKYRNDSIAFGYYKETKRSYYKQISLHKPDDDYDYSFSKSDSLKIAKEEKANLNLDSIFATYTFKKKANIYDAAKVRTESIKNDWDYKFSMSEGSKYSLRRHMTGWHEKITLSVACLIFFFIGAPLGGIIRKGGIGMPVVVSVMIFIFYYIINNSGYKMARDGHWIVWMGMWMSTAILAPIGAFLTYKSNNDSVVFNPNLYISWIKKLLGIRTNRHIAMKEVVIFTPDYQELPAHLNALTKNCEEYIREHELRRIPSYIKIWTQKGYDDKLMNIDDKLTSMITDMSNSQSSELIMHLNKYPIMDVRECQSPFSKKWINILLGLVLPLGFVLYLRIWWFRIRLNKDLKKIITTNNEVVDVINRNITNIK